MNNNKIHSKSAESSFDSKKDAIDAYKKAYTENSVLMQELENNAQKDSKKPTLTWRKGRSDSTELGDFIRDDIMVGSYGSLKESDEMPSMYDRNTKTRKMYERYFIAKNSEKGLDSDPVVKAWVEYGDKKAKAIKEAVLAQRPAQKFDDKAHMAYLNGQRGR